MILTLVPDEQVNAIWRTVEPLIQSALDTAPGRYEPVDILVSILKNEKVLWVAFEEESKEIVAACVTYIYNVPLGRVMQIEWVAGSNMAEWQDHIDSTMEEYAKDFGCTKIECHGRDGWWPLLKNSGWHKASVSFEKDLTNG